LIAVLIAYNGLNMGSSRPEGRLLPIFFVSKRFVFTPI